MDYPEVKDSKTDRIISLGTRLFAVLWLHELISFNLLKSFVATMNVSTMCYDNLSWIQGVHMFFVGCKKLLNVHNSYMGN